MKPINILLIEDNEGDILLFKESFEDAGILANIEEITDGKLAIDYFQHLMSIPDGQYPDLIFLDINLPKLKGFDFIKTIKNPPNIIITTAYHEFALRGYEHNVIDYLMKPVAFTRFLVAVNKLKQSQEIMPPTLSVKESEREYLFFNVSKKKIKVYIDEILYIESVKEYVNVVTADKSITVKFQLSQVEALLPKNNFIRIHRSYMVAKNKILAFSATDVEINDKQIPIGRSYKELVLAIIEK